MMKKTYWVLTAWFICGAASAFDYDLCVQASQEAPYNMDAAPARAACAAKRGDSGASDTAQSNQNFRAEQIVLDRDNAADMFDSGELVVEVCVGSCDRDWHPVCPSGYELLEDSIGRRHRAAYHGRYPTRGGICRRS